MSHAFSTLRVFSSRLIRARLLFVAFAGIMLFSGMAHASLIPSLIGSPVALGNGQFRFDYRITLTNAERLDPNATNGATCPGPSNSNIQCDPAGTFVTIYDIPGFVGASFTANASTPIGGFFSTTASATGATPNSINGAAFDNALMNVTFRYSGPIVNGPAEFTGFSIVSMFSGTNPFGNFTSQATNNTASSAAGTTNQEIGSVVIPRGQTAASVGISGRIMTAEGKGISGITVTLTGLNGEESKTVLSGKRGYYSFPDVQAGETYLVTVSGKRFNFVQSTQLHTILDEMSDINFIAYAVTR